MRRDIAMDPEATHYCKHCGLTMSQGDQIMCPACDGDMCEPVRSAWARGRKDRKAGGK